MEDGPLLRCDSTFAQLPTLHTTIGRFLRSILAPLVHERRETERTIARIVPTSTYVRYPVESVAVIEEGLPVDWERERRPGGVDAARRPSFVAFRHSSGDVRLRIAPPNPELERHAHQLTVTLYPGTELATTQDVRSVTSEDRVASLAVDWMKLFDGAYDGPRDVERAATFATERIAPADVVLDSLVNDDE